MNTFLTSSSLVLLGTSAFTRSRATSSIQTRLFTNGWWMEQKRKELHPINDFMILTKEKLIPISHRCPVHPFLQVQTLRRLQCPPLRQLGSQAGAVHWHWRPAKPSGQLHRLRLKHVPPLRHGMVQPSDQKKMIHWIAKKTVHFDSKSTWMLDVPCFDELLFSLPWTDDITLSIADVSIWLQWIPLNPWKQLQT